MAAEKDPREEKLSKWAQELVQDLRYQIMTLQQQKENHDRKMESLREAVDLLRTQQAACEDLLQRAARGEHLVAQNIVEVLKDYRLEIIKDDH